MSLKGFIRKFFGNVDRVEEVVKKNVSLEDLPKVLVILKDEVEVEKRKLLEVMRSKVDFFINDLEGRISSLESIDVTKRKEHEKIKAVSSQNLEIYVSLIMRLLQNLREVNSESLESYVRDVSDLINDFTKSSRMPFERATLLIGKELGSVRDFINSFIRDFGGLMRDNNSVLVRSEGVSSLDSLLEDLASIEGEIKNFGLGKDVLLKKISSAENELRVLDGRLSGLRSSGGYVKDMALKSEREKSFSSLNEELRKFKGSVDFKILKKNYHSNKKLFSFVKSYNEGFIEALKSDEGLVFGELLKSSELVSALRVLRERLLSFDKVLVTESDKSEKKILDSIKYLESEIKSVKNEMDVLKKSKDKLIIKKNETLEELSKVCESLGFMLKE